MRWHDKARLRRGRLPLLSGGLWPIVFLAMAAVAGTTGWLLYPTAEDSAVPLSFEINIAMQDSGFRLVEVNVIAQSLTNDDSKWDLTIDGKFSPIPNARHGSVSAELDPIGSGSDRLALTIQDCNPRICPYGPASGLIALNPQEYSSIAFDSPYWIATFRLQIQSRSSAVLVARAGPRRAVSLPQVLALEASQTTIRPRETVELRSKSLDGVLEWTAGVLPSTSPSNGDPEWSVPLELSTRPHTGLGALFEMSSAHAAAQSPLELGDESNRVFLAGALVGVGGAALIAFLQALPGVRLGRRKRVGSAGPSASVVAQSHAPVRGAGAGNTSGARPGTGKSGRTARRAWLEAASGIAIVFLASRRIGRSLPSRQRKSQR